MKVVDFFSSLEDGSRIYTGVQMGVSVFKEGCYRRLKEGNF
jgi:hypothetical protein